MFILLMYYNYFANTKKDKNIARSELSGSCVMKISIITLIAIGICVQAYFRFSPSQGNYISQFEASGDALILQTEKLM